MRIGGKQVNKRGKIALNMTSVGPKQGKAMRRNEGSEKYKIYKNNVEKNVDEVMKVEK